MSDNAAEASQLSTPQAVNRGFNMMAAALLGLSGLAFGSLIFEEADPIDKVDNLILVIVAIVTVVWYLAGTNRYRRTPIPVVLAGVAFLGQILAFGIEYGDPSALGDDIGGLLLYLPMTIFLAIVYSKN